MATEVIWWKCKGDKKKAEKEFYKLRDFFKLKYPTWSGMISFCGDDNAFSVVMEYKTLNKDSKEEVADAFTDLISSLNLKLLN